jgi:7-cyano-7-deazaguanine synthase
MERAVILLSGGLDSATTLAIAREQGFECYALSFAYGQRHRAELDAAARVARAQGAVEHRVVEIPIGGLGGSALTDSRIAVPVSQGRSSTTSSIAAPRSERAAPGTGGVIPVTYVPARNTVFLSLALAWAEVLDAQAIFIGANSIDYSGYPDCRPEFIAAFQALARLATKQAVEGRAVRIEAPLIHMSKADIIRRGADLGVDFGRTVSCYNADAQGQACGRCDSCAFRREGFRAAGISDPTRYA